MPTEEPVSSDRRRTHNRDQPRRKHSGRPKSPSLRATHPRAAVSSATTADDEINRVKEVVPPCEACEAGTEALRWRVAKLEQEKLDMVSTHNQEVSGQQAGQARLRAKLERGEEHLQELQYQLALTRREAASSHHHTSTLTSNLTSLTTQKQLLQERAAELHQSVCNLQKALEISRQAREEDQHALQQDLEERDQLVLNASAENTHLTAENTRLHTLLQEQEAVLGELKKRLEEGEREGERERERARRISSDLELITTREEKTRRDLEGAQQRVRSLEDSIETERAAHLETKFNSEIIQLRLRDLEAAVQAECVGQQEALSSLQQLRDTHTSLTLERDRLQKEVHSSQAELLEEQRLHTQLLCSVEKERRDAAQLRDQILEEQRLHTHTRTQLDMVARRLQELYESSVRDTQQLLHQHTSDQRTSDQHTSDQHTSDQHTSDQHTSDQHTSDQHTSDPQASLSSGLQQHTSDQRTSDQHTSDQHTSDQHTSDPQASLSSGLQQHTSDQHTSDQHTSDQHTSDQHTSDQHTSDQQASLSSGLQQHTSDQHTSDQHTSDQRTSDQHTSVETGGKPSELMDLLKTTLSTYQHSLQQTTAQVQDLLQQKEYSQQLISEHHRRIEECGAMLAGCQEEVGRLRSECSDWMSQSQNAQSELQVALQTLEEERERRREREREEREREEVREEERERKEIQREEEREREKESAAGALTEVQKITELYENDSQEKLGFLLSLYQRLLAGCVLLPHTHDMLGSFSWAELCDVIQEHVDTLTSDLSHAHDRVSLLEGVCDRRSECVRELEQRHRSVLETMKQREDTWNTRTHLLEQKHLTHTAQMQNKIQVCVSQVQALQERECSLEQERRALQERECSLEQERSALQGACLLLGGALGPLLERCHALSLLGRGLGRGAGLEGEVRSLVRALGEEGGAGGGREGGEGVEEGGVCGVGREPYAGAGTEV
ncbi:coiled-coil domain-containing protein 171-like [Osmerus mordax]|uniref:coiled-coil domain-containing protein 171-like n=1 Tax=Osmerus mordax TaxID=8014 RepID=UPI003510637A